MESLLKDGDQSAARAVASRLIELAPDEDTAWALRARAELDAGDPDATRRTLARARDHLERELGSPDSASLDAVAKRLEG